MLQSSGLALPSCIPAEVRVTDILAFGETQPSLGSVILATAATLHEHDPHFAVMSHVEMVLLSTEVWTR